MDAALQRVIAAGWGFQLNSDVTGKLCHKSIDLVDFCVNSIPAMIAVIFQGLRLLAYHWDRLSAGDPLQPVLLHLKQVLMPRQWFLISPCPAPEHSVSSIVYVRIRSSLCPCSILKCGSLKTGSQQRFLPAKSAWQSGALQGAGCADSLRSARSARSL